MRQTLGAIKALMLGISAYEKTGVTPEAAHQALINLYCRTQGSSNDFLHNLIRLKHPPVKLPPPNGILGNLSPSDIATMVGEVREKGYYMAPALLPAQTIERILNFSLTTPANLAPPPDSAEKTAVYDPQNPKAITYDFDQQTLVNEAIFQEMMADPSFLAVAQAYLSAEPLMSQIALRWSTPFSKTPSDDAAQLYHFDMERVKWIRFFFYLTDVTPERGPHCFIPKTHRSKVQPLELLKRGYARITDEEMERFFPKKDQLEIIGQAGKVMILDTRAFHKGKMPTGGDRLLLDLTYASSLFGSRMVPVNLTRIHSPALQKLLQEHPRMYARYQA